LAWLTSLQDRNLNAVEIGWPFRLGLEGRIVDRSQDIGWQRTFGHGRKIVPEKVRVLFCDRFRTARTPRRSKTARRQTSFCCRKPREIAGQMADRREGPRKARCRAARETWRARCGSRLSGHRPSRLRRPASGLDNARRLCPPIPPRRYAAPTRLHEDTLNRAIEPGASFIPKWAIAMIARCPRVSLSSAVPKSVDDRSNAT
jgi:hypothetical protein